MEHLNQIKNDTHTLIFYEAPHKLLNTLQDLEACLGNRNIAIAHELTKVHQEVIRTTLSEAAARYTDTTPKGEFVLVIEGAKEPKKTVFTLEEAIAFAQQLIADGAKPSDAAKEAAKETGWKKGDIYKGVLLL